jgi:hypothetical protein
VARYSHFCALWSCFLQRYHDRRTILQKQHTFWLFLPVQDTGESIPIQLPRIRCTRSHQPTSLQVHLLILGPPELRDSCPLKLLHTVLSRQSTFWLFLHHLQTIKHSLVSLPTIPFRRSHRKSPFQAYYIGISATPTATASTTTYSNPFHTDTAPTRTPNKGSCTPISSSSYNNIRH